MASNLNKFLQSFENGENCDKKSKTEDKKDEMINSHESNENSFNGLTNITQNGEISSGNSFNNKDEIKVPAKRIMNLNRKSDERAKEEPKSSPIPIQQNKIKLNIKKSEKSNDAVDRGKMEQKIEKDEIDLEQLFKESETPIQFKEKWFELHHMAVKSNKQTMTNQKIRNGKFRLDEMGVIEILPDFKTYGKSSNDLLHEVWKIN